MAEQEAADLSAGRVRLADLDSDDDYDYGVGKRGGRKKGRRKGKSKRGNDVMQNEELGGECTSVAEVDSMKASGNNETVEVELEDFDEKEIDCSVSSVLPGSDSLHEVAIVTDNVEELCNGVDNVELASDGSTSQESSEEEEPDSWRCECCRKDFKSHKQFENHEKSKKHKEMLKKYEKKFQKEALRDMMDELEG